MPKITPQNIWTWPRPYLESRYLELARRRDLEIGIAFCAGGLFGGVLTVLMIGWLP